MHNYLAANFGYVTTDNLPVLSGFQEKITALQATLNQPEAEQSTGKYATLGDAYVASLGNDAPLGQGFTDDVVDRQQEIANQAKPSVSTMTEPIPEHSQPEPMVPTMTEPIQRYGQPEPMVPTMTEPIPVFSQPEGAYFFAKKLSDCELNFAIV